MKKINIPYTYIIENIGSAKDPAYKAFIPAFQSIVYDDTLEAINEGVAEVISDAIKEKKQQGLPVPPPERDLHRSGKLVLRVPPSLHSRLATEAAFCRKSLNSYLVGKLNT